MDLRTLVEETYKKIDLLAEKIFNKYIAPAYKTCENEKKIGKKQKFRIVSKNIKKDIATEYPVIKFADKVELRVLFTQDEYANPFAQADNYDIYITIPIRFTKKEKFGTFKYYTITELVHELTHAIDYTRSQFQHRRPKMKLFEKPSKERYRYQTDPLEINATVHEFNVYRKKYPEKWNRIRTAKGLFGVLYELDVGGWRDMDKTQREQFLKKMVKRLYRENMLPKAMQ